jgi:hypothetical protein
MKTWWLKNRPSVPTLFDEEIALAVEQMRTSSLTEIDQLLTSCATCADCLRTGPATDAAATTGDGRVDVAAIGVRASAVTGHSIRMIRFEGFDGQKLREAAGCGYEGRVRRRKDEGQELGAWSKLSVGSWK